MSTCEGLGPVAERQLLGQSVAAWQASLQQEHGVVLAPTGVCSPQAAAWMAAEGRKQGEALHAVPTGTSWRLLDGFTSGPALGWRALADSTPIDMPAEERQLPGFALPSGPLWVADRWAINLDHWGALLWANLLGLGPALWRGLVGAPLPGLFRLLWAAMRAGSLRPDDVAARLTRASGASIHRNATVEGCVLGPGARVGAGAVVRGCILGPGAIVEELAMVEGSVLGAGAVVQRQAMVKYSVIEDQAYMAGLMQLGVVGKGAVVKRNAVLMDMTLNQTVKVQVNGQLLPAPHGMIGVCVGPGATIGYGVLIAPGRCVPPGLTILPDGDTVVRRLDLPPGCTHARVRGGGLVAVE